MHLIKGHTFERLQIYITNAIFIFCGPFKRRSIEILRGEVKQLGPCNLIGHRPRQKRDCSFVPDCAFQKTNNSSDIWTGDGKQIAYKLIRIKLAQKVIVLLRRDLYRLVTMRRSGNICQNQTADPTRVILDICANIENHIDSFGAICLEAVTRLFTCNNDSASFCTGQDWSNKIQQIFGDRCLLRKRKADSFNSINRLTPHAFHTYVYDVWGNAIMSCVEHMLIGVWHLAVS